MITNIVFFEDPAWIPPSDPFSELNDENVNYMDNNGWDGYEFLFLLFLTALWLILIIT